MLITREQMKKLNAESLLENVSHFVTKPPVYEILSKFELRGYAYNKFIMNKPNYTFLISSLLYNCDMREYGSMVKYVLLWFRL